MSRTPKAAPAARRGAGLAVTEPSPSLKPAGPVQLSLGFDAIPPAPIPPPAPAPTATSSGPERRILLSGDAHNYRLRRARRRTIGFQIDDRGLTVSAPRWVSLREIEAAIVEKERWIRTRLEQWRQWRAKRQLPQVVFADGGRLPFLGTQITLRLRADLRASEPVSYTHLTLPTILRV